MLSALRRIGTIRMRGHQHLQFAEDCNLIGFKRTQNKLDEIDPATGKALSSHPVLIEGKPFESKEFQEGPHE